MAKTYTAAGSANAGDVYTSSAHNVIVTDVNNLIVPPIANVSLTTNASVANTTNTWFGFTSVIDTDSMVTAGALSSTIGNAGKITINTTGVYMVSYAFTCATDADGYRYVSVHKNGAGDPLNANGILWQMYQPVSAFAQVSHAASGLLSLTAGDYLQLGVYHQAGAALQYNTNGSNFSVYWVGRTS